MWRRRECDPPLLSLGNTDERAASAVRDGPEFEPRCELHTERSLLTPEANSRRELRWLGRRSRTCCCWWRSNPCYGVGQAEAALGCPACSWKHAVPLSTEPGFEL